MVSGDYLEILAEFANRVTEQVKLIEADRAERGISPVPLTAADCIKDSNRTNFENQLVVIKPEKLTPSARTADRQLLLAVNGSGCNPNSSGRAVFCKNLFTGESARWERYDIAGIIRPDRTPEWAKEKLATLQKPAEKPSILTGLDEGKKAIAERGAATKPGKRDGQEL